MAKNKSNDSEYEEDNLLLELDSEKLENASETSIKSAIEKLKKEYTQKRNERLEKAKKFVTMYKAIGDKRIELFQKVKSAEMTVGDAIEEMKKFVADF